MERELLFTDKLQELRETAKAQGNLITEDQLQEAFSELSFDEEQLAMVREYLAKHKIGIGKPVDTEENLTGEEKNFLEMYLKELKELPAVNDGEKQALTMSAMAGDSLAQEKLCTAIWIWRRDWIIWTGNICPITKKRKWTLKLSCRSRLQR